MTKEPSIQELIEKLDRYKHGRLKNGDDGKWVHTGKYYYKIPESELHFLLEAYAKEQREICAEKYLDNHGLPAIDIIEAIRNAPSPLTEKQ